MYSWMLFVLRWKIVADYGNKNVGVFVMSTEDYLTNFYPTIQTVLELYYSLAAVNAEISDSGMLTLINEKVICLKYHTAL